MGPVVFFLRQEQWRIPLVVILLRSAKGGNLWSHVLQKQQNNKKEEFLLRALVLGMICMLDLAEAQAGPCVILCHKVGQKLASIKQGARTLV